MHLLGVYSTCLYSIGSSAACQQSASRLKCENYETQRKEQESSRGHKFSILENSRHFGTASCWGVRSPKPCWKRVRQTGIEISCIPRNLIIVIFYYQISLKPLKTLSLSQVSFPLLFPLYYIVPPVFTNSDKGKYKGKKIL